MIFSKTPHQRKSLLCLDIGTTTINACVFEEIDHDLQLKGVSIVPQGFGNMHNGAIIQLSQTLTCVQEAVRQAENKARISAKDLIIGLSGELTKGMTVQLTFQRTDSEREIDQQELKSILHELQWQAFDRIRGELSDEMCLQEIELKLVNASIISVQIDGVPVTDPVGKTGKLFEVQIFNCFAPLQHYGQIQTIAVELAYHELKGIFAQTFSICHSLMLSNPQESAVVIDIGSGTTDVCVMVEGKVLGNRSFSLAGNALTKRIAYALSLSFDEAEHIKLKYSQDQLERKSQMIVQQALHDDIELWLCSLEFCLKELPMKHLPKKFLLSGKSALLPEFSQALKKHDWNHHFPFEGEPTVRMLDYTDLLKGDFNSEQFDPDFLPLVSVANTASDLLYNHSSLDQILGTIIADKGV